MTIISIKIFQLGSDDSYPRVTAVEPTMHYMSSAYGRSFLIDKYKDYLLEKNETQKTMDEIYQKNKTYINTRLIDMIDAMNYSVEFCNNKYINIKEKDEMYNGCDGYDTPINVKEIDSTKVLLYEAWGIPKGFITYSKEFVNKTRETFLVIKGQYANERIGFENDINVRLKIDTKVYNGYTVFVDNGMIQVTLYEIPNEEPEFKDLFGDEDKGDSGNVSK